MRRREVIALIGSTTAWPISALAQQPTIPVIGFLSSLSSKDASLILPALSEGLTAMGFVEGRNLVIEYRWAEGDYQRLPMLAAELVRRNVAVIAAISGTPAALAAKAATTTMPLADAPDSLTLTREEPPKANPSA